MAFNNQDYKFFNGTKNPDNHRVTCSILRLITGTPSGTVTPYGNRDTIQFFGLLT